MTTTETKLENPGLGQLDFDPRCDYEVRLSLFGRTFVLRHCDTPSRWFANMACCSHQMLSCPKHRYYRANINQCARCKRWVPQPKLRWRRI
jgi:hypothetical protein